MKNFQAFFILFFISFLLVNCGGPSKNKKVQTESTTAKARSEHKGSPKSEGAAPLDDNSSLKATLEWLELEWKDVPKTFTATFKSADVFDYFHLDFEDGAGKVYDFGYGDNKLGGFKLYSKDIVENPEWIGESFELTWDWKMSSFPCCEGEMTVVKAKVPSITKLVLFKK